MKINKKEPISLGEIKALLGEKKENENKRVEQLREYINKFAKLDAENAKKLREELKALGIAKLDEEHIVKLVDLLPEDADDVRKVFYGSTISLSQSEIQKILEVVAKYRK